MADLMTAVLGAWSKYLTEGQDVQVVHTVADKIFAPDVKFQVVGQPGRFQLAVAVEGVQAMKSYYGDVLFPVILSVLDVTKPISNELVSMTHDKTQGMVVMESKTIGSAKDGTSYSLSLSHRCTYVPHRFSVY